MGFLIFQVVKCGVGNFSILSCTSKMAADAKDASRALEAPCRIEILGEEPIYKTYSKKYLVFSIKDRAF